MIVGLFVLASYLPRAKAAEKDLYNFLWLDPDKKVYVLQNKVYKREHTVYLDVGYLKALSSKFQNTNGFKIKGGYYFKEEWAVELFFNKYSNSNNDTYQNAKAVNGIEPFIRRFNSSFGLLGVWTPFYGKINTFNRIYYFDWSFGAGPAFIKAESNLKTAAASGTENRYDKESMTGAMGKTELRFHLSKNVHIGLEYQNTMYKAAGPRTPNTKSWCNNGDALISVGFSF